MENTKINTETKKRKGTIITVIIIVSLLVLGGGGILFLQFQNENTVWTSVQNDGSISGYKRFIEQYPSNRHVGEAKKILEDLLKKDDALWAKVAASPTKENLQSYLNQMSKLGGSYVTKATEWLDNMEWDEVVQTMDPEQIRAYMSKFPGRHEEEATALLNNSIKKIARGKIQDFLNKMSDENIEAVMDYFEDYTPVFRERTDVSRYDLYDDMKAEFIEDGKKTYTPDFGQLEAHEDSKGNLVTVVPVRVAPSSSIEMAAQSSYDSYDIVVDSAATGQLFRYHIEFTPNGKISHFQVEE